MAIPEPRKSKDYLKEQQFQPAGTETSCSGDLDLNLSFLHNFRVNDVEEAKSFVCQLHQQWANLKPGPVRRALCGNLRHLGPALYPSAGHFIYELIQNADYCSYRNTLHVPTLRMMLTDSEMIIFKNEDGFSPADVYSICNISEGTKFFGSGSIGNKGIGFKAVFAATHQPLIFSPPWSFKFEKGADEVESYITPLWIEKEHIPDLVKKIHEECGSCGSLLYLPYHPKKKNQLYQKGKNSRFYHLLMLYHCYF